MIDDIKLSVDKSADGMGREIKNSQQIDRFLITATQKAFQLTNAIVVLCENNYSDEAFPVLRSLMELSVNMRWIIQKDTPKRLSDYLADLLKPDFGSRWTTANMEMRMKEIGYNDDYYSFVTKYTYSFSHVNAKSLNWSIVEKEPVFKKFDPEAIFSIVVQMLIGVMKALNDHYEGCFEEYKVFDKKIKVTKNFKAKYIKKFNEIIEKDNEENGEKEN